MSEERPFVVSIAGFDPSGGAGVLADVKTFEQCGVYGFGVCSAMTIQTDNKFLGLEWLEAKQIFAQLRPLSAKFKLAACKIGLLRSFADLARIAAFLKERHPGIRIVCDPVLKATAGHDFHKKVDVATFEMAISLVDLLTPNAEELSWLETTSGGWLTAGYLAHYCPVLLKGGHRPDRRGIDTLFEGHSRTDFSSGVSSAYDKHGSGCVLSSAITASLALGHPLPEACRLGKAYTEQFLNSNQTLLGYHSHD